MIRCLLWDEYASGANASRMSSREQRALSLDLNFGLADVDFLSSGPCAGGHQRLRRSTCHVWSLGTQRSERSQFSAGPVLEDVLGSGLEPKQLCTLHLDKECRGAGSRESLRDAKMCGQGLHAVND